MQKQRVQFIDFMKGIAIFNILLIHLYASKQDVFFQSIIHRLGIPVFVFVTGYAMGYLENRPYVSTIVKKLSYILQMLFIFLLLSCLVGGKTINTISVFTDILHGEIANTGNFVNMALWYLPFYISLFLILFTMIKLLKCFYEYVLKKYGGWNILIYFIMLIFVSLAVSRIYDRSKNISFNSYEQNPFYIYNAVVMQFIAVVGYIVFHIENKINEIIKKCLNPENDDSIIIKKINEKNIPIQQIISVLFLILFIVSTHLFIHFSKKYGMIDVLPLFWSNNKELYISCILTCISIYCFSKIICNLFGNFILVRYISYMGKRSLLICCIHCILITIATTYYETLFPSVSNALKQYEILRTIFTAVILSVISVILSWTIEREK